MKLIFIRHAEPDYEHDSLTEKGKREAACLVKRVSSWKVTDFYCSPMGRAKETAAPTLKVMGRKAETREWLHEFDRIRFADPESDDPSVIWDRMPEELNAEPDYFDRDKWTETSRLRGTGIAAYYEETCRSADALLLKYGYRRDGLIYRISPDADRDAVVVCFCHLGVTLAILSHLLNVSPYVLWQGFFIAPASVTVVGTEERDHENAYFRTERMGDTMHLRDGGEDISYYGLFDEPFQK